MRNPIFPKPIIDAIKYIYCTLSLPIHYGKEFRNMYAFLKESQWWSREKLEEYQMQQLKKLLNHAYENVPYYRRVFDERGLKPKNIQDFNDFKRLPFLTKDIVRENLNDLVAKNIPKQSMNYVTTGGTSGKPLGLYIEKRTILMRMAFEWREWNWMGYKFGDRCVVLRGNVIKRKEDGKPAWWEYDRENNYLILSTYDMMDENLSKYVEKIEKFKPKVIRAYPSALDILAKYIKENNIRINAERNIKAISTSSENLYPAQRQMIEKIFKCKVFDKYGNCEQVTILGECEKHEGYHDFMEYSYMEILDEEGKPVSEDGEIGQIVSTGFTNYALPFIRYKTEDLIEYTNHKCSCGRRLPLIKRVEGRKQGFIIAADRSVIRFSSVFAYDTQLDPFMVKEIQFIQENPGELLIKIVKNSSKNKGEVTDYVKNLLILTLGKRWSFDVKFVRKIPRTRTGKYKFLIQRLPVQLSY